MLSSWLVVLVALGYLGLLFAVARWGERRADEGRSAISPNVYALSLAVFCTSWTFYGSVGRAATGGYSFLTIYLGPTLMMLFAVFILKMLRVSKALRLTSIADFLAARYGKSQQLAGLVTLIALLGIVPYIALQLKAVAFSLDILFQHQVPEGGDAGLSWWQDTTLVVAALLAFFTILFGTRHLDATERHEGMVLAVAFESVVKLVAFLAVGLFVTYGMFNGFGDIFSRAASDESLSRLLEMNPAKSGSWLSLTLLSGLAIVCLPRQFQIMVVENLDEQHLRRAIWLFPLYLLVINLFVLPVALGGMLYFGAGQVNPDTFMLALPLSQGAEVLALLVFVGGLSAATGMVIVETIALSTMVCNDLVMPVLLRSRWLALSQRGDISGLLLNIRRGAIVVTLILGYLYFRLAGEAYALVAIGLISFSAVAQFAPAMVGGLYWKEGNKAGAFAGLLGGFLVWTYTLLLPSFAKSGWISGEFVSVGLWGISWLKAQALFGLAGMDEISHCLFWSMLVNVGLYAVVSLFTSQGAAEAAQASQFVDILKRRGQGMEALAWRGQASVTELLGLLERFLGPSRARSQVLAYANQRGVAEPENLPADADFVHFAETQLAGAIGTASARVMVGSTVQEEALGLDEVLDILDEASQVRAYSHELEQKSLELEAATNDLREANERLRELDRMKDDFISTVTHELRTPLTSIRAFSEMLFEDPKLDLSDRHRFLGIIVSETERLTRLINQILDLAKMESGRADWITTEVDLGKVLRDTVASLEQLFRDRGVRVRCVQPDHGPVVLADRDRLTQVMINLLSNAVKFVPQGEGLIDVSLVVGTDELSVSVRDNGPGIRLEDQGLIFEKFCQGGNTMTDKPQGTGLGLPISRQIVEYFGGRLWVESQVGAGACFTFTLPLPDSAKQAN